MNASRRPSVRWWWIATFLVGLGMAASSYLLARTFALLAPSPHTTPDICSTLFSSSCDGALGGDHAWMLGVPLAGWGLVYFATLAALIALARFVGGGFQARALLGTSGLAVAGVVAGLALSIGALQNGTPLCPMCVSVHATSLALVLVLERAINRPVPAQLRFVRASWASLRQLDMARSESVRWPLVGLACVALFAIVAWQWVYVESALRRPPPARPPDRKAAIAAFVATPRQSLPVSERDPHRGSLGAPAQLVVFESLQCPHCQRFEPTLSRLERMFGARLVVVLKHYPLSSQCNARLHVDAQPDACELAWAAEAANRQQRFWPFHDAMLAAGSRASAGRITDVARAAGLDATRFEADLRSTVVRERVSADIALGNELQIPGTPAVYLNGRLVRPASAELLEILIRHELQRGATQASPLDRAAKATRRPDTRATSLQGG